MPAPTITDTDITADVGDTGDLNKDFAGTLSWNAGDFIVVMVFCASGGANDFTSITGGGLSFTQKLTANNSASDCRVSLFTAIAPSTSSATLTININNTGVGYGGVAWSIGGSNNLEGATAADQAETVVMTVGLTRQFTNSLVLMALADWNAVADTTVTPEPVTGGTQRMAQTNTLQMTAFAFDWSDQGAPGLTNYGITGFTGGNFTMIAVEIPPIQPVTRFTLPNRNARRPAIFAPGLAR